MVQAIGTVVPYKKRSVVAALTKGICEIDINTGKILKTFANPEAHIPNNRFNDGKCDPQGRLWVGSMSFDIPGEPNAGVLYSLDKKGKIGKHAENLAIPNGLCWSADSKTFYHIDTPEGRVDAYDFDAVKGAISNKRTCIKVPEGMGYPDGCTIDSDGKIWIAFWGGWCVARFCPETGELLAKIPLPCS